MAHRHPLHFFAIAAAILLTCVPLLRAQTDSDARRVFNLTNQDRQQQGLPLLTWNPALAAAAEAHAQRMLREPSLSHHIPASWT